MSKSDTRLALLLTCLGCGGRSLVAGQEEAWCTDAPELAGSPFLVPANPARPVALTQNVNGTEFDLSRRALAIAVIM